MNKINIVLLGMVFLCQACAQSGEAKKEGIELSGTTIKERIKVPNGFYRQKTDERSFGHYLQNLKLLPDGAKVIYFNGIRKPNQKHHVAVIEMDVGTRDLQQCADAIMRLYAEFRFSKKNYDKIAFNFVSDGKPRYYLDYAKNDTSYKVFRKYMNYVFSYANTRSLYYQLKKVEDIRNMETGDVFIQTGNPYGHAVIVVDMAYNPDTGEKIFLLAQSYMPAQSIHVLANHGNKQLSPWYKMDEDEINTPEWTFNKEDLRRFKK